MKAEDIASLLDAQSFHSFTVFTNDGRSALVGHRELAKLTSTLLFVFAATEDPTGIPERVSIPPLAGIACIDLTPRRARRKVA